MVFSVLSKSAEEYSIHGVSLEGDEFRIVGASPTINSDNNACRSALKYLGMAQISRFWIGKCHDSLMEVISAIQ
jgi:hypothetical protein